MAARKKSTVRRKGAKGRVGTRARERSRQTIDEGLAQLEKQVPKNLRGIVKDLRKNLKNVQKQIDQARSEREARWERLERQMRSEAASMLRRLEKAIEPGRARSKKAKGTRKKSSRKAAAKRKGAAARKRGAGA